MKLKISRTYILVWLWWHKNLRQSIEWSIKVEFLGHEQLNCCVLRQKPTKSPVNIKIVLAVPIQYSCSLCFHYLFYCNNKLYYGADKHTNVVWIIKPFRKKNWDMVVHLATWLIFMIGIGIFWKLELVFRNLWLAANPGEGTAHSSDNEPILIEWYSYQRPVVFSLNLTLCFDVSYLITNLLYYSNV